MGFTGPILGLAVLLVPTPEATFEGKDRRIQVEAVRAVPLILELELAESIGFVNGFSPLEEAAWESDMFGLLAVLGKRTAKVLRKLRRRRECLLLGLALLAHEEDHGRRPTKVAEFRPDEVRETPHDCAWSLTIGERTGLPVISLVNPAKSDADLPEFEIRQR